MESSTMNVETSNVEIPLQEEEVFHESSESFQEESSSSSLDDDVQQSSKEVEVPSSNTQSVSNNMVPNADKASTSHNVFNEHLEDAYFDASIDCDETFAPVARIESIRLFLAYASHKVLIVFQMDVKTTFLNEILKEEAYANPNEHHVSAVKRIFCYLKRTINLGLWYQKDSGFDRTAYSDADHAGCHLYRKSTSGSVQFLDDKLVCWSSKKQNCVSISTAESE
nr:uncharacterized mitochondrial protein AtMg00810-like [Tanacetum cinerariifolium]